MVYEEHRDIRIAFMGTPEFAASVLNGIVEDGRNVVLVVCQPDKPVGRKMVITPPPAKVEAIKHGIDVFQPASMRTDEAYEEILKANPDLIITAAYGKILPERILDIPSKGSINVHASLLPKYRGAAPVQYSILNGDATTGVTIMNMDVGMDTGDILRQTEIDIDENIHTDDLMNQLAICGTKLLLSMLDEYLSGNITPIKQQEDLVTLAPPISKDSGIIDWTKSSVEIHNMVRALSVWPGASTLMDANKLKIYDTRVLSSFDESTLKFVPEAGQIVEAAKGNLTVKCGSGYIRIMVLQTAGGKKLSAIDCAHNFTVGKLLGV